MRHFIRAFAAPQDGRMALVADALGVIALFALMIGALHLPLFG
tara:strand:+ start:20769 stop:20897 length:129 start_codon:yes stop_codon:yes gene_type:complete